MEQIAMYLRLSKTLHPNTTTIFASGKIRKALEKRVYVMALMDFTSQVVMMMKMISWIGMG